MLITSEPLKAKSPEEVRNQLKSDLKQLLGDGYVSREFLTDSKWFDDALRSALAEVILWAVKEMHHTEICGANHGLDSCCGNLGTTCCRDAALKSLAEKI